MSHGLKPHWKPIVITTEDQLYSTEQELKHSRKPWRPITLRKTYLAALIITTLGLIVIIQWLSFVSRTNQGIIFAENISDLPLSKSFYYLYLPTIISVIYSFLWTWVDLDVKRLEPYFQLSKDGGANGSCSILLNYPLEFLMNVPFIAFKKRHWHVLSASTIMMLIFWGLTPTQAGIFAIRTIEVSEDVRSAYSSAYIPVDQQTNLFGEYAQSVSNIAWLNETLPPFMTKDYALGAFGPSPGSSVEGHYTNCTGETYLYSVDLSCEKPLRWEKSAGIIYYNTTRGCSFYGPTYRPMGGNDTSKPFDTMYEGYSNLDGKADYYLSSYCNDSFTHSFFVRWTKSSPAAIHEGVLTTNLNEINETSLFCEPSYYRRKALNATIGLPSKAVVDIGTLGAKETLPKDLVNITAFEWQMSAGTGTEGRTDYPTNNWPDQKAYLVNVPLNLAYVPKMAPFAIATTQHPFDSYLDPETLRLAYQSAYRLLFARHLTEVLKEDLDASSDRLGHRSYITQAVVVIPGFAYTATVILGIILLLAIGIFATTSRRPNKLREDAATLRSLMNLTANDSTLIQSFSHLDSADAAKLDETLDSAHFHLEDSNELHVASRIRMKEGSGTPSVSTSQGSLDDQEHKQRHGIRPFEMKLGIGTIFLLLQVAAAITFATLYFKARKQNGLSLPSDSTFVRQLVENYIPIALATLIEPFWLVLNKMLCLLLPYEQLRKGNALGSRSIDLDYSSLPPQLLFWKAFRAGHFVLMLVCFMVLAANILAVALSGLMSEEIRNITTWSTFVPARGSKFVQLNGTGSPFNTKDLNFIQGGTTSDQFYRDMSNLTADTPLPNWTDEAHVYQPYSLASADVNTSFRISAIAHGAELECRALDESEYTIHFSVDASEANLTVVLNNGGEPVNCTDFRVGQQPLPQDTTPDNRPGLSYLSDYQPGHVALEMATMLSHQRWNQKSAKHDLFCRQHYLAGWIRADWKYAGGRFDLSDMGQRKMKLISRNETMVLCKPRIKTGPAEVVVDSRGQVRQRLSANLTFSDIEEYFSSSSEDLIAQANQFLTNNGATWHNDSCPSDFINYLIKKSTNDTTLLDPSLPPPKADHAINKLSPLYKKLFAILLGSNIDLLLENPTDPEPVSGSTVSPETRIVFSTPAFIIVEGILTCYIITTIFFYARRPWRVLPRLPSTLASNFAFFAASRALRDIHEDCSEREDEAWTWAYGTFVGTDGRTHTGIEREPLVAVLKNEWLPFKRER